MGTHSCGNCENGPYTPNREIYSNGNCGKWLNTSYKMAACNGNSGNEPLTSEQVKWKAGGRKAKWRKKCVFVVFFSVILIVTNVSTAVISIILTKSSPDPCPRTTVLSCPSEWVGYEGRCYHFSEAEGTWDFGQSNCSAYGASLTAIENQKEMMFIMRHKGPTDHWIGLKRKEGQPWEWADRSIFNGWFEIGADGFCAYLNDESASSTWCHTERNWICSKSVLVA